MSTNEVTRNLLAEHYKKYPELHLQDIFKYIYQSSFGCEHMVPSLDAVTDYMRKEYENAVFSSELYDKLDGEYTRVHFSVLQQGLSINTFAKLFYLSAKKEANGERELENKLSAVRELISENILKVSLSDFENQAAQWKENGYPAVRHSDVFRKVYSPAYRVIADEFVFFMPLFVQLDKMLSCGCVVLAIDGKCGGGKSTLGKMLERVYDCTVLHMDDFFLRPEQRTPGRFAEVGGNVDRERFLSEVLIPLSQNRPIDYRCFDCSSFEIKETERIYPKKLTVIEGTYSMHPCLSDYYDLSVFIDISEEKQKKRIEKRNSPEMAVRFFNEWIPKENEYFRAMNVKNRCSMAFDI